MSFILTEPFPFYQLEKNPLMIPEPVCRWLFQESPGSARRSGGRREYLLQEHNGPISRVEDGICGRYSMEIHEGQWLNIPRSDCPELNFYGRQALSMVAWVKRAPKSYRQCETVAGMWNETGETRQYSMFLDLAIWDSRDSVCGHLSSTGRPSPDYEYCMEAAIGARPVEHHQWHQVAFTFDGLWGKVYLDGKLDSRPGLSPYFWPCGINRVDAAGSDFTVGAVHRWGEMGNFFAGRISGLAVYDHALTDVQIGELHRMRLC